ncbi:proton-conducting transporter membrane subunit [Sulfobacillus thermosulfidooxidans]|uniref:proton-conducting transporter transmembrane domain-containing protein n=1 Tax=Sulfobacillus thermosulfidooxidans TaxID=28034 RepID=UPI000A6E8497|nr:proton-conducting transporter membrane subunit [Sulfobacillus thermosulfidooxidans]
MLVGLVLSGMILALLALMRRRTYGFTIVWGMTMVSVAVAGLFVHIGDNFLALSPLRSWFLMILGLGVSFSSWYRIGYEPEQRATTHNGSFWFVMFVTSMMTVIVAQNVWLFMTSWELMTVTSFFLVVSHPEREGVIPAGFVYLVMSQVSALCILLGLLLMGLNLHSMNFSDWYQGGVNLPPHIKLEIFSLLATGFAIKSGIVPFHIWLPRAHPVAPAPVSSLMSGVMIKLGVFGIIQFVLIDLGPLYKGTALALLAFGAISGLLGVLYALMERDLKTFLAYSSIENMGIIFLGLGTMALGIDTHQPLWISLGLIASLLHSLNHAIFKTQLFLAAGAVEKHTHTLNMDHLGGLQRTIPFIATGFLVGSLAISGIPPFNGFISEWMTLRALLEITQYLRGFTAIFFMIMAFIMVLTASLALLGFVQAFGVTFLGQARAKRAQCEVPQTMRWPIGILAGLALLIGIYPNPLFGIMARTDPHVILAVPFSVTRSLHAPVIAGMLALIIGVLVVISRPWDVTIRPRWACGRESKPSMQWTSASFTKAVRTTFALIYRPHRRLERIGLYARDFPEKLVYKGGTTPFWERYIYGPSYRWVWMISRYSTKIQAGPVRLYLTYLLATIGLMLWFVH